MKTISLWQPWASLWAAGVKKIETRHWPLRGRFPMQLAVHAAKRFHHDEQELCLLPEFAVPLLQLGYNTLADIPRGCIVGTVTVSRVIQFNRIEDIPPAPEVHFGNYTLGRYGWITTAHVLFPRPIPARGYQSLWEWDPDAAQEAPAPPAPRPPVQPSLFDGDSR
jgi:hypothetical protein